MPEIGKRIKIKREELHMTQEELAAKLGYKSKTTIEKLKTELMILFKVKLLLLHPS